MLWYCHLVSFHFSLRTSLTISHKAGLMVLNTHRFCLCGKVSISPSFSKDTFVRYSILIWWCFFFKHIEYMIPLPDGLQDVCWNSAHCFMRGSLYVTSCFFIASLTILILSLTVENLIIMCHGVDFLDSYYLVFFEILGSVCLFSYPDLRTFQPLFF